MDLEKELAVAKEAAVQAGYAIMDVYENAEDMQITYKDGRKRVIECDIGGGTIDGIMGNYLKKIFGRNYDD